MATRCWRHALCRDGAGVTDARREPFVRRRVTAVAVTVASLAALIVLVQGLGSPSRGDLAVREGGSSSAQHRASSGVSADARSQQSGGNLLAGSDPGVLPGPVLIADRDNNRLL